MPGLEFPAITMWQPWASLLALGVKRHETRAFPLPRRLWVNPQWVAIHSAARSVRPGELSEPMRRLCVRQWGPAFDTALTHRAVLALVKFGEPRRTTSTSPASYEDEIAGDWSRGRWAWPVIALRFLDEQQICAGRQGWWRVTLDRPPDLSE